MKQHLAKLKSYGIKNHSQELTWMKNHAPNASILDQWVQERCEGKPLAYILKSMDFMDLSLYIDERVLVPRPETEVMVEHIISNIQTTDQVIVDLGTGSGCIALSLKKTFPEKTVVGVDIDQDALEVAIINQKKYEQHRVQWVVSDWLSTIDISTVDVIIANPPYVETSWKDKSIQLEPHKALYSDKDGLRDIRTIIQQVQYSKGKVWIEHGHQHTLSKLFNKDWNVTQHYDLNKQPRFINAMRTDHDKE
ncbi:MAG: hypothetical protein CMF41_03435 [Legionellales bacterium]|nr:hypothetical protein [Legionellales bacterium]OUX65339.1 MAG: hypothetical protein CBE41_01850 [Gammaproteobacteria bacterium TMED281]